MEKSLLPKEVPQVELKHLLVNIKYELLGPHKTYNVIVNSELYFLMSPKNILKSLGKPSRTLKESTLLYA